MLNSKPGKADNMNVEISRQKTMNRYRDLKPYGIEYLTGEACAYGQRVLCDMNEDGKKLIQDWIGVTEFQKNWNSSVNGKPAVASIMLDAMLLPALFKFILMHIEGYRFVVQWKDLAVVSGFDERPDALLSSDSRLFTAPSGSHPSHNGRNTHQFSGRSE